MDDPTMQHFANSANVGRSAAYLPPSSPAVASSKLPFPLRWLVYAFCFSLAFEAYDPFGITSVFTIAKMIGILLSLGCLVRFQVLVDGFRPAVAWFGALVTVVVVTTLLNPGDSVFASVAGAVSLFQSVALMWICCGAFRNDRVATNALWRLVVGCALAAVLCFWA